jgi:hypothetical protein
MNSPQGLQHDYCNYFGQTVDANAPAGYTEGECPGRYACNKGIGQLDKADIRAVERQRCLLAERVRYQVDDLSPRTAGCCDCCVPQAGIPGCNSVITISRVAYNAALDKDQTPEGLASVRLFLALLMIHEAAHAAGNHLFGVRRYEDYRENSNVAEAGLFGVHHLNGGAGGTAPEETQPGILGVRSIIWLGADLYGAAQDETRMLMEEDDAYIDLYITATLLHEVAHAAHFFFTGHREEDYFEDSLIAEAGFEFESRIFGMIPEIDLNDPFDSTWQSWQNLELQGRGYNLRQLGRKQLKIARKKSSHRLDCEFALKLVVDKFWTGEYAERGGIALIPDTVIKICRKGGSGKAYKAIPSNIKELWMEREGINYAHKKWSPVANKDYEIRKKAVWVCPW